jgi:hypothetical protein
MKSMSEWWRNRQKNTKFLIITVLLDLSALIVTFLLINSVFFIVVFLNIVFIIYLIPTLYLIRLAKQPISSKEYYLGAVDQYSPYMDETILTKMFEIRINNRRNFLFAFLALLVTITFTIAFNKDAYNFFNSQSIVGISSAKILIILGYIEVLVCVYYVLGFDREIFKELDMLFKARKKLETTKKTNLNNEKRIS